MSETFHVRNFESFQHYKDRAPPWIKLYNALLDDYAFGRLPDAGKSHLIAIWLLASRSDNCLPYDGVWIYKRINATSVVDLGALEAEGFIERDAPGSRTLAPCMHLAGPEREGETEAERETEKSLSAGADPTNTDQPQPVSKRNPYPAAFDAFWRDYPTDPLMSKKKTFEFWQRLDPEDRAAAHAAIAGFRDLCARDSTYRPVHAQRFLADRRFDGFVNAAAVDRGADAAMRKVWDGAAAKLVDEIGAAAFQAYFAGAKFAAGPPATIGVPKPHLRDLIARKYAGALARAYGAFEVEVAA